MRLGLATCIAALAGAVLAPIHANAAPYTFKTFSVAGAYETILYGINDAGQVSGFTSDGGQFNRGFVDTSGMVTQVNVLGSTSVAAIGISNTGEVAGFYSTFLSQQNAFIDVGGDITTINAPDGSQAVATGVNSAGQVVGYYGAEGNKGFLYQAGVVTQLSDPDLQPGSYLNANNINDAGQIVGVYVDGASGEHSFVDTAGVFTPIDVPGAIYTFAGGINASGQIAGTYEDASFQDHGFVDTAGNFTTLDFPDGPGSNTEAFGINDAGQVVGYYFSASRSGTSTSFIATPIGNAIPEPTSLLLLSLGLAGLAVTRRHTRG